MASRRHWSFIVRDQYGYVIQNAKVNVFQPGTSTAFTGTAYNADSGGGSVTNPFTTNSQGEVEAWFDNAQVVDVRVDDNTDMAYRAVNGASAVVSFSTFTEADVIFTDPADVPTEKGATGDVIAAIVNPFAAVTGAIGASGKWADAAHAHPYTPVFSTDARVAQFTPAADLNDQSFYSYSIPANTLVAGASFKFRGVLYWTNAATISGLQLKVRLNSITGNVVALGPVLTSTATTHTDTPVTFEGLITVRTIGASGTVIGDLSGIETITIGAGTKTPYAGAIITAVVIDTTAANTLEVIGDIQTSNTGINYKVDLVSVWQVA